MCPDLADAQVASSFGLNEVVDAGAAATHLRFDRTYELEAWNRSKELAWLGPYPLGVGEMTRIVVRPWLAKADAGLAAHRAPSAPLKRRGPATKTGARTAGPLRIVGEQLTVFLHRRAATCWR